MTAQIVIEKVKKMSNIDLIRIWNGKALGTYSSDESYDGTLLMEDFAHIVYGEVSLRKAEDPEGIAKAMLQFHEERREEREFCSQCGDRIYWEDLFFSGKTGLPLCSGCADS